MDFGVDRGYRLAGLLNGIDVIVHLSGIPDASAAFEDLLPNNILPPPTCSKPLRSRALFRSGAWRDSKAPMRRAMVDSAGLR